MTASRCIQLGKFTRLGQRLLLGFAISCVVPAAYSQVSPPDEADPGVMSSLDQAAMYPVQTQMAETPNLNSLNENADTVKNADNALTRGPFFFAVDTTGTVTSNLKDTFDDQPSTAGAYLTISVPVGIHLWTPVSDFGAYFKYDTNFYPGHSDLNHSSEIYSHQLIHELSDTTTTSWSLAGGHVVGIGHYLSPEIGIGTTGVVAPQEASGLQPLSDAATTYSIFHKTSERDSWTAAGTAGWIDEPVLGAAANGGTSSYREVTGGGDAQWQRALNSREIGGVEFTNVYVKGLSPSGMSNFASAKLTFAQSLTPHASFTGGIGPLFTHSALAQAPVQDDFSYTANAGVDYRRLFGHINAGYSRVYEVGYLSPTSIANELYLNYYRRLTSKFDLTADSQYLRSSTQSQIGYSSFGFSARLDMYITQSLDYHIEGSSFLQPKGTEAPGYHDNNFAVGVSYYFGSPLSRAGVQ
jgi:hypothetical protein